MWVFPRIGLNPHWLHYQRMLTSIQVGAQPPKMDNNAWFRMERPIKRDDLPVPGRSTWNWGIETGCSPLLGCRRVSVTQVQEALSNPVFEEALLSFLDSRNPTTFNPHRILDREQSTPCSNHRLDIHGIPYRIKEQRHDKSLGNSEGPTPCQAPQLADRQAPTELRRVGSLGMSWSGKLFFLGNWKLDLERLEPQGWYFCQNILISVLLDSANGRQHPRQTCVFPGFRFQIMLVFWVVHVFFGKLGTVIGWWKPASGVN